MLSHLVVNFTVVARETVAEKPKSSSALVTVYIRDTNDNFPIFSEDQYEVGLGATSISYAICQPFLEQPSKGDMLCFPGKGGQQGRSSRNLSFIKWNKCDITL